MLTSSSSVISAAAMRGIWAVNCQAQESVSSSMLSEVAGMSIPSLTRTMLAALLTR
ncbi:hypothetical protein D3C76_991260 [compost metagenome]